MFKKHKALASIRRNISSSRSGSILGATLIILGIVLVSALSVSFATLKERKASTGTNKSNQAFQMASDGIELVMQDILNGGHANTTELNGCQASGLIVGSNYTVELRDQDENVIACNVGSDLALVKNIKSVGSASDNQRAIEAAVAATEGNGNSCYNLELSDESSSSVSYSAAINGCRNLGSDWYLPTQEELACFVLDPNDSTVLWTRTSYVFGSNYGVRLSDGNTTSESLAASNLNYYRCVR